MNELSCLNKTILLTAISFTMAASATASTSPSEESDTSSSQTSTVTPVDTDSIATQNTQLEQESESESESESEDITLSEIEWQWADQEHEDASNRLDEWANEMDGWFGEPDLNEPASASLRVILDTRWVDDPIEGSNISVEPRVRGRLRLPVLERHVSLIIGDEELDEEAVLRQDASRRAYNAQARDNDRVLDSKSIREDNASIALRWSQFGEKLGVETDIDVGVHSVDDLYVKVNVDRDIYESGPLVIDTDNFYRYGLDSEHYVKGELNMRYSLNDNRYISDVSTIRYRNKDNEERTSWANDLRQVHNFGHNKQLSYGLSVSGDFKGDAETLNSYGPAISYRQPIWREWLFIQTELNYYNDESQDKDHYPSALLRFEALF